MVGSEARLVGRKKARVFKIGKELEGDQTFDNIILGVRSWTDENDALLKYKLNLNMKIMLS